MVHDRCFCFSERLLSLRSSRHACIEHDLQQMGWMKLQRYDRQGYKSLLLGDWLRHWGTTGWWSRWPGYHFGLRPSSIGTCLSRKHRPRRRKPEETKYKSFQSKWVTQRFINWVTWFLFKIIYLSTHATISLVETTRATAGWWQGSGWSRETLMKAIWNENGEICDNVKVK